MDSAYFEVCCCFNQHGKIKAVLFPIWQIYKHPKRSESQIERNLQISDRLLEMSSRVFCYRFRFHWLKATHPLRTVTTRRGNQVRRTCGGNDSRFGYPVLSPVANVPGLKCWLHVTSHSPQKKKIGCTKNGVLDLDSTVAILDRDRYR